MLKQTSFRDLFAKCLPIDVTFSFSIRQILGSGYFRKENMENRWTNNHTEWTVHALRCCCLDPLSSKVWPFAGYYYTTILTYALGFAMVCHHWQQADPGTCFGNYARRSGRSYIYRSSNLNIARPPADKGSLTPMLLSSSSPWTAFGTGLRQSICKMAVYLKEWKERFKQVLVFTSKTKKQKTNVL
jgi:hypothetical protein